MREILSPIVYFWRHDPAAIIGLLFIAGGTFLYFHIQLKMIRAGYPLRANALETPAQYLKVYARNGWSPWPAYLLGPCILLGIVLLILGLFRL